MIFVGSKMKCDLINHYEETLSELTQLAYAAAVDSQKWQLFLNRASEMCGGMGIHLFGHDDATNSALGVMYGGYDPIHTESFNQYYGKINSWAPGLFQFDAGVILHTEMMCPQKELIKTEFYSGWCKPQEDLRTGGGVILHKEASRMFALGGNIRKKDGDQLDSWWLRLLGDITPHMQQAIEITRAFNGMHLEKVSLAETRSPHDAAVIVISSARMVVYTNAEGRKLLVEGQIVKQSLGGKFDFSHFESSRYLSSQLLRLSRATNSSPVVFPVVDGSNDHYVCRVVRHLPDILGFSPIDTLYADGKPYFLITLAKSLKDIQIKQQLKDDFYVTDAEAKVVLAVAKGQSPDSIAKGVGRSIHTVRNQLKRAMAKMDINRQAELAIYIESLKSTTP